MLTKNVWQLKGLYNGSLGTVKGLMFRDGVSPPHQPYCILIEFDEYRGPAVVEDSPKVVPIITETVQFDGQSGKSGSRQQFPLVLGWAITIHKSQGLTLKTVVLGLGGNEYQTGLTYVGCSRVKSWQGLAFHRSFPWERMEKINQHAGLTKIREEIERLKSLTL